MIDIIAMKLREKTNLLRRAAGRYDRFMLLHYPEEWQCRAHLVVPISAAACAIMAVVPLGIDEWIPPVDQFLYPQLLISSGILGYWIRSQRLTLIGFASLQRRVLLRMFAVRLTCIVSIIAPPFAFNTSLRARLREQMSIQTLDGAAIQLRNNVLRALQYAKPGHLKRVKRCVFELERMHPRDPRLMLEYEKTCRQDSELTDSDYCYLSLNRLMNDFGHPRRDSHPATYPLTLSRAVAETLVSGARSDAGASCPTADGSFRSLIVDKLEHSLSIAARVELWRKYAVDPPFPRRNVRVMLYFLGSLSLAGSFLRLWMDLSTLVRVVTVWSAFQFAGAYMAMMGWLGARLVVELEVGALFVGMLAVLLRALPLGWICAGFAFSLLSAPIIPIAALWWYGRWSYVVLDPVDGGLFTTVVGGFMYERSELIANCESLVYLGGIGLLGFFVVLVGPSVHRYWVLPK